MTRLELWQATQHEHEQLPADHAFEAFLAETDATVVQRDLEPVTAIERRHLAQARRTA